MATFAQGSPALDGAHGSPDITPRELAILLSRLKQSLLRPAQEDERRLRTSQYERTRVESNLRFARSALHHLEQQSSAVRPTAKRVEPPVDLDAQREVLEMLFDRLEDYNKLAADYDDDDDEGSSEEDLLGDIIPTPNESQDPRRSSEVGRHSADHEETIPRPAKDAEPAPESPITSSKTTTSTTPATTATAAATATTPAATMPTTVTPIEAPATHTSSDLRARGPVGAPPHSSPPAHSTARAALFAGRRPAPATTATTAATAEAILDQQRGEQEAILDSIRRIAGALKQSSQSFSASLESDRGRLDAAGASMEKSGLSMEAAQGRMGSLRRMTEGEGWWGRMLLYAWVYGLMLVLLVVVFVLPKLRF